MACALGLARRGRASTVVEKDSRCGGLCQTIDYDGFLFDIGGHRFLSRLSINALWRETMGNEPSGQKAVPHLYGQFFKYPFPLIRSRTWAVEASCASRAPRPRVRPADDGTSGWIIHRFGLRPDLLRCLSRKVLGLQGTSRPTGRSRIEAYR
jgi:protoporphyrinogen oxidase